MEFSEDLRYGKWAGFKRLRTVGMSDEQNESNINHGHGIIGIKKAPEPTHFCFNFLPKLVRLCIVLCFNYIFYCFTAVCIDRFSCAS